MVLDVWKRNKKRKGKNATLTKLVAMYGSSYIYISTTSSRVWKLWKKIIQTVLSSACPSSYIYTYTLQQHILIYAHIMHTHSREGETRFDRRVLGYYDVCIIYAIYEYIARGRRKGSGPLRVVIIRTATTHNTYICSRTIEVLEELLYIAALHYILCKTCRGGKRMSGPPPKTRRRRDFFPVPTATCSRGIARTRSSRVIIPG